MLLTNDSSTTRNKKRARLSRAASPMHKYWSIVVVLGSFMIGGLLGFITGLNAPPKYGFVHDYTALGKERFHVLPLGRWEVQFVESDPSRITVSSPQFALLLKTQEESDSVQLG